MATILIVESDNHLRRLYRDTFVLGGIAVIEAADASTGISCVQHGGLDAVVLDIAMPDGLEALKRIHEMNPMLPVVLNAAYTAYTNRNVQWIGSAYVIKSANPDKLRQAVLKVLDDAHGES